MFDPSFPTKKPKPSGVKFIGCIIAYTDADAPEPSFAEYSTRVPETKRVFSILYSTDKAGKKMWVICWYMSPTGKPSPMSVTFSLVTV